MSSFGECGEPGFGLVELSKRLGLERRTYYAGKFKDMLDPFRRARSPR